MNKKMEQIVND